MMLLVEERIAATEALKWREGETETVAQQERQGWWWSIDASDEEMLLMIMIEPEETYNVTGTDWGKTDW